MPAVPAQGPSSEDAQKRMERKQLALFLYTGLSCHVAAPLLREEPEDAALSQLGIPRAGKLCPGKDRSGRDEASQVARGESGKSCISRG